MQLKDIGDLEVIALAQRWHRERDAPGVGEALVAAGVPPKLAHLKILELVRRDLLDFGVSTTFAWPTEKGRALLPAAAAETA